MKYWLKEECISLVSWWQSTAVHGAKCQNWKEYSSRVRHESSSWSKLSAKRGTFLLHSSSLVLLHHSNYFLYFSNARNFRQKWTKGISRDCVKQKIQFRFRIWWAIKERSENISSQMWFRVDDRNEQVSFYIQISCQIIRSSSFSFRAWDKFCITFSLLAEELITFLIPAFLPL